MPTTGGQLIPLSEDQFLSSLTFGSWGFFLQYLSSAVGHTMGKLQAVYWVLVALSLVITPALRVAFKNLGEKSETPSNKEKRG